MKKGKKVYVLQRRLSLLAAKLGLEERLKKDRRSALRTINRTLKIYQGLGFLYGYTWAKTQKGERKVILFLNPEKLPHLKKQVVRLRPAAQSTSPSVREATL